MHNRVGLGTFPLAGVFTKIAESDAQKLVQQFVSEGGYYIDTAPIYGNGYVESLIAKALKKIPREKYFLISKTVKHVDARGRAYKSGKREDVIKEIDNSLMRLQTDYLDVLMVHSPDENVPIEETLEAMQELQKSGKVKELAVSNVNLSELRQYNKTGHIKYVQNRFSLISRSIDKEFESYMLENNISFIPYHLLEIGLLTGIAFENYTLKENDLRKQLPYWNEQNQQVIFKWVRETLSPIAKKNSITIGQLNIAWALSRPFIHFVIVGTTNLSYLKINLKAHEIQLGKETLIELDAAYKKLEKEVEEKYNTSLREFRGLNEKYY